MEITERYIELIQHLQAIFNRELNIEELQFIKQIIVYEINKGEQYSIEMLFKVFNSWSLTLAY